MIEIDRDAFIKLLRMFLALDNIDLDTDTKCDMDTDIKDGFDFVVKVIYAYFKGGEYFGQADMVGAILTVRQMARDHAVNYIGDLDIKAHADKCIEKLKDDPNFERLYVHHLQRRAEKN